MKSINTTCQIKDRDLQIKCFGYCDEHIREDEEKYAMFCQVTTLEATTPLPEFFYRELREIFSRRAEEMGEDANPEA